MNYANKTIQIAELYQLYFDTIVFQNESCLDAEGKIVNHSKHEELSLRLSTIMENLKITHRQREYIKQLDLLDKRQLRAV